MWHSYRWVSFKYRLKEIYFIFVDKFSLVLLKLVVFCCKHLPLKILPYVLRLVRKPLRLVMNYCYLRAVCTYRVSFLEKSAAVARLMFKFSDDSYGAKVIDPRLAESVARILLLSGQREAATKLLQTPCEVDALPERLIQRASSHFDLGDFSQCQKILDEYINRSNTFTQFARILQIENPRQGKNRDWYDIISLDAAKEFNFSLPKVYPQRMQHSPEKTIMLAPEQIYHLRNAEIFHGHLVVGGGDCLFLYDPSARPCFHSVAGYQNRIYGSHFQMHSGLLSGSYEKVQKIDSAILLNGRCGNNYFHWLIEYLSRYCSIQKLPKLTNVPLLIDATLGVPSREVLQMIAPNAPIVLMDQQTKYEVENLYIPSFHTFHPDNQELPFWVGSGISHAHLSFLREAAYRHATILPPTRRLFLTRATQRRSIGNNQELARLLQKYNFESVDPGALNFIQQVELFASARYIVGGGGAAFTNLIFCQPECTVIGLVSPQLEDFCMQSNLADFAGSEFIYVSGQSDISFYSTLNRVWGIHTNYAIPPQKLEAVLQKVLANEL
jgi:hypothetical protein